MQRSGFLAGLGLCAMAGQALAASGPGVSLPDLGITDGDVFETKIVQIGDEIRAEIVIDGSAHDLVLSPHNIRGASFGVWADDRGARTSVEVPSTTYRGHVEGLGAGAAFGVVEGALRGVVTYADGEHDHTYAIEPIGDGRHVSYALEDVVPGDHRCVELRPPLFGERIAGIVSDPISDFDCTRTILVAFDADFEYYQLNGSSVPNTVADIEGIMNAANFIYERDTSLSHVLGEFIIRTDANDPYTSTDAVTRLFQFRDEWNNNQGGVEREAAHFFTGANLDGNIIGGAWVGVICEFFDFSYAMSQARYTGNFSQRVGLVAHELGHNWNADHCDGDPDCGIMCSFIDGCPCGVSKFGQRSIDSIVGWAKDHEFCLGEGPDCDDCPADLNGDGVLDSLDFLAYLDAFAAGDLAICDLDLDGDCDADDFFDYLDLFSQGC